VNPIYWPIGDDAFVRSYTPDDAAALFAVVDEERARLHRWFPWVQHVETVENQRAWIERVLAAENDLEGNGIWLRAGGLAGGIGMTVNALDHNAEIGYWLRAACEGRGLVTRATGRFLDHAFRELELRRVTIRAAVPNERSRAVAARLGFTEEGVMRQAGRTGGGFEDLVVYGMLREEWAGLPQ
jgi:ribosomal-protein-serine acetyltransferase